MKSNTKTFRMSDQMIYALETLSNKYGMTQTEMIERSIEVIQYLDFLAEKRGTFVTEQDANDAKMTLKLNGFYIK